jgi:ribosomal protein S18 acetylase RimI-like enzyme
MCEIYNKSNFSFEKADKELFAVYNTIYSDTDIEMWNDWNMRLKDTMWSDDAYFVLKNGERVGGAIISNGYIANPYLIPPYCDKVEFFMQLHKFAFKITDTGEIQTSGMLADDLPIMLSIGYRVKRSRRGMIRPTDMFESSAIDYMIKTPDLSEAGAIASVFHEAYLGGIHYEVFGSPTVEEITEDALKYIEMYINNKSIEQCCIIYDNDKPVAAALIGCDPSVPNNFTGISDIGVIPEYRNRGLAEYMIKRALTFAHIKNKSQAMRLFVTLGNPAEVLYRKLGFLPGPSFTNLYYKTNR